MIPNYPDQRVIEMIKTSLETKKEIFKLLFLDKSLRTKAYMVTKNLIPNNEEAENLYLDSLIEFISAIVQNKYKYASSLTTYFIGIYRIYCLRKIEKAGKSKKAFEDYIKEAFNKDQKDEIDPLRILASLDKRYETRLKQRISKQLSGKCKKYLEERYCKMMSIKDIAKLNQINDQSVRNLSTRCLKNIRELILNDKEIMEYIKANYGRL